MVQNLTNSEGKTVEVKVSAKEKKTILVCDIIYIKAIGKFSVIYMQGEIEILAFHMLKWFEEHLPSPCFFRAHYSYIVSCHHIRSYCYEHITLNCDIKIPLSRNRLEVLKIYYFMLGDNFYHSEDSRFWGFVPDDNIVGKAVLVLFSVDKREKGFMKIRWGRVMKRI